MNDKEKFLFERMKMMPPLSHWPNRPVAFKWENSQVVAHIRRVAQCDITTAAKLFGTARLKKVLVFDHSRMTWSGNRAWVPVEPKRRRKPTGLGLETNSNTSEKNSLPETVFHDSL